MIATLEARIGAAILAALFCFGVGALAGHRITHNAWEAELQTQRDAAARIATQQAADSAKVEIRYVDRIEKVSVPVETIRTKIVRAACAAADPAGGLQQPAADRVPVPAADPQQPADAAAPAHADTGLPDDSRLLDGLVADIRPAAENAIQLEELQALIRANTAKP